MSFLFLLYFHVKKQHNISISLDVVFRDIFNNAAKDRYNAASIQSASLPVSSSLSCPNRQTERLFHCLFPVVKVHLLSLLSSQQNL